MALLTKKRFLPLFITQFFGAFNDNAFKNAFLIWFTYHVGEFHGLNSESMLTIAAAIFILPFFILSATAGQIADYWQQERLARIIKLIEIMLMLACSWFFYTKSIFGLLFILFAMGIHSTFFGPIKYSLLPAHLPEHELISGNALIEAGTFLAILLGTIFGGLIVSEKAGLQIFMVCVVGFAVTGYLSSCFIPYAPVRDHNIKVNKNIWQETKKILTYARIEPKVWYSILGISCFWFLGSVFLTQFPIYTKEILFGDEHIVTLFLGMFSFGIGFGSISCNLILRGKINAKISPYGALGMFITGLILVVASYWFKTIYPQTTNYLSIYDFFALGLPSYMILFSLVAFAYFAGIFVVPLYAIMQHASNPQFLSRIVAANNVMNALFMVAASLLSLLIFAFGLNVLHLFLLVALLCLLLFFEIKRKV